MQLQGKLQMIADSMASRSEPIRCAQKGVITFIASSKKIYVKLYLIQQIFAHHDEVVGGPRVNF